MVVYRLNGFLLSLAIWGCGDLYVSWGVLQSLLFSSTTPLLGQPGSSFMLWCESPLLVSLFPFIPHWSRQEWRLCADAYYVVFRAESDFIKCSGELVRLSIPFLSPLKAEDTEPSVDFRANHLILLRVKLILSTSVTFSISSESSSYRVLCRWQGKLPSFVDLPGRYINRYTES